MPGPQIIIFNIISLFISGKQFPLITTNYSTPALSSSVTSHSLALSCEIVQVHKVTALYSVLLRAQFLWCGLAISFSVFLWAYSCPEQLLPNSLTTRLTHAAQVLAS